MDTGKHLIKQTTRRSTTMIWLLLLLYSTSYSLVPAVGQSETCVNGALREDLLSETPRLKDIINSHSTLCSEHNETRHFKGISLGYVTPWNNHGYDIAKRLGNKFTHVSPVWLQIKYAPDMRYKIGGSHDIDKVWIKEVKQKGVKVVPRILFDRWSPRHIEELLDTKSRGTAINVLVRIVNKHNFDGIVLEGWMQLLSSGHMMLAMDFVKLLSAKFKELNKDFILVIPAVNGPQTFFGSKHFSILSETVTAFSMMTYDYSGLQTGLQRHPGPNSPLYWMKESVELISPQEDDPRRAKILLGLNFYGNHFIGSRSDAIIGTQFLDLIKGLKGKMKLEKESGENFIEIKTKSRRHTVFYPTLYSISRRLQLAEELGVGIAIWELGQGLDYFYELL